MKNKTKQKKHRKSKIKPQINTSPTKDQTQKLPPSLEFNPDVNQVIPGPLKTDYM